VEAADPWKMPSCYPLAISSYVASARNTCQSNHMLSAGMLVRQRVR
jgi:hypothetical protein